MNNCENPICCCARNGTSREIMSVYVCGYGAIQVLCNAFFLEI